jgi:hypothetical protein
MRFTAVAVILAACSSSSPGNGTIDAAPTPDQALSSPDAATTDAAGPDASTTSATHAPFPKVIEQGGPITTAPFVVSITFMDDLYINDLTTFGTHLTQSAWWTTAMAGDCLADGTTCIGTGPDGMMVTLPMPADKNYTDTAVETLIGSLITAGTVPPTDANTIYNIYFPTTTTITASDGTQSCVAFDAYHASFKQGGKEVIYSLIPECEAYNPPGIPPITTLQYTTLSVSHEIAEAASDPLVSDPNVPYSFYPDENDPQSWAWLDWEDGELADLCVDAYGLGGDETLEGGYMVQRIWSIANAAAGKNPCVPIPDGEVYFNAAPTTSEVIVDVGQTVMVEVDAWADGPIDSWTLNPQEETDSNTSFLTIDFVGSHQGSDGAEITAHNGDKIMMMVTLKADPKSTPSGRALGVLFSYVGSADTPSKDHYWPFVVLTTAEAQRRAQDPRYRHAATHDPRFHRIRRRQHP